MRRSLIGTALALFIIAGCGGGTTTVDHTTAVETISAERAHAIIAAGDHVVIDIRTPEEFAGPHLEDALNLDFYAPTFAQDLSALDPSARYVLYCRSGNRSAAAMEIIRGLGFTDVHEIDGGIVAWSEAGLPLETP